MKTQENLSVAGRFKDINGGGVLDLWSVDILDIQREEIQKKIDGIDFVSSYERARNLPTSIPLSIVRAVTR